MTEPTSVTGVRKEFRDDESVLRRGDAPSDAVTRRLSFRVEFR